MIKISESDYYAIALSDYSAALLLQKNGFYNQSVRLCQQTIEKYLKSYFDTQLHLSDKSVLDIHSTLKLYESFCAIAQVEEKYEYLNLCRKLVRYYHNTNYPGSNYLIITQGESLRTVMEVYEFMDFYNALLITL